MKQINNIIGWKIIEIIAFILIITISFPIWKKLEYNNNLEVAAFYNNAQFTYLEVNDYQNGLMMPISNENALQNMIPTKLNIGNDTKTSEEYSLLLRITKDSSLDFQCLNVALNNKVESLSNLYITEDSDNYYFKLVSDTIVGGKQTYDFLLWMDEKTGNEMQGKTLNYAFEIQKETNI